MLIIEMCLLFFSGNPAIYFVTEVPDNKEFIAKVLSATHFNSNIIKKLMQIAVRKNKTGFVESILPYVTDQSILDKIAKHAICNSWLPIVKLLMEAGAQVDVTHAINATKQNILNYLLDTRISLEGKLTLLKCVQHCMAWTQEFERRQYHGAIVQLPVTCCHAKGAHERQALYTHHATINSMLQKVWLLYAIITQCEPKIKPLVII